MNLINLQEIAINIFLFASMLILIIGVFVVILSQFEPFKECENKNDSEIVMFAKEYFTCGELKAMNFSGIT